MSTGATSTTTTVTGVPRTPQWQAQGFHSITPQLFVPGCLQAIDFYIKAFGAEKLSVMLGSDPSHQKVMHAEIKIGDSRLFLGDACDSGQGSPASKSAFYLYVPDVDVAYKRAVDAGCEGKRPPKDMFWGDRMAALVDPYGQIWDISTHVSDPTPEEMKAGREAFEKQMMADKAAA